MQMQTTMQDDIRGEFKSSSNDLDKLKLPMTFRVLWMIQIAVSSSSYMRASRDGNDSASADAAQGAAASETAKATQPPMAVAQTRRKYGMDHHKTPRSSL